MIKLIKNNPIVTYYIIAFGWTWTIVLALIITGQVDDINKPSVLFVIGGIVCNLSPSIAAFIVLRISQGKEAARKLRQSFSKSSTLGLYTLAILTVPLITVLNTVISNFTIRAYEWNFVLPLIIMGLVWPIFSSTGEEFGWRGYILPQLISKYGYFKAALILGVIWSFWHFPMYYIAYRDYGSYMIPAFLIIGVINLTIQTVIMTCLYAKSNGSIRLMVFYHYTITSSGLLISGMFKAESTPKLVVYESLMSVIIFAVFAAILYIKTSNSLKLKAGDDKHE